MEQLAREITYLARELRRDLEGLFGPPNRANGSNQSTLDALARIEERVGAIHGHTAELIRRVPKDLGVALVELLQAMLARLDEAAEANEPAQSADSPLSGVANHPNRPNQSAGSALKSLSPQERRVFQLCFRSGFLSYRDIAEHLDITPTATKNLINRIFLSEGKRQLFSKQYEHGAAKVGVQPQLQGQILTGSQVNREKRFAVESADG